jgi:coenzyme F420-0:L-glutamate ligase/coenzyme F420-1:gamma-L-glutamate ligase
LRNPFSAAGEKTGFWKDHAPITLTVLPNIPLIQRGDDLAAIILRGLCGASIELEDDDGLVLAQKIVSQAEHD